MKKYKEFKEFYKKYTLKNRKKPKRASSILSFIFSLNPVNSNNICSYCKKPFDKRLWCEECDPRNIIEGWTSEDIKVDKFIKDTMYDARNNDSYFNHFLEWVPFERLANVEQIGEGGYFKVYSAVWVDGKSTCINKPIDKSFRRVSNLKPLMKVVLKKLKVSHNGMPDLFLNKVCNNIIWIL
ncbi:hypothetical protein RhiirA5_400764 [Rhizophagus irregularis]|uniref:Protein kinase domain-containing protein n=1 Tax=Rhizophagus irregularis TaxID=588596 RepID=A0A2N0PG06_9GLOM|nr:hypothetical protein RhiirA5_400764 [Rhizophagus irregularis]